ncbi:MAG: 3-hydroxyacyl-CoA dehydrogenase NAD-binding domain-containing protein [Myxococcota bacterium]|nr:3-hydroxyacyl-CoA dehydrogenase NAD-binding domain-containing protein [Myxococcota bacterium]
MIRYEVDDQGIATITWDMQNSPMNVLNEGSIRAYADLVEKAIADDNVKGVVVTSARNEFIAGADLRELLRSSEQSAEELFGWIQNLQGLFRKQETGKKPFVAAINGTALGGGLELTLACHYRVAADNPRTKLGLPEVKLGLLPGGGGTQRLARLIGARASLPLMTEGKHLSPDKALEAGMIHAVVPADELLSAAKQYILDGGSAKQPWDDRKFRVPDGGVQSPKGYETFIGGAAMLQKATWGVYPAPKAIMACVYHGLQLPIDQGLKVEARQFVKLARGAVAQNMIRTLFFSLNDANKLKRRPEGVPTQEYTKVGVLGAGMMGAGLAYSLAFSGVEVVLIDRDAESAERGKAYSEGLLQKRVKRGRMTEEAAKEVLDRITPTTDYAQLEGAQMVIEAVFEDRGIKATVTKKAEEVLGSSAIFASNTSTLPITGLAEASSRPANFIGLHFFSPVDKMPLVEIIVGEETSDETLARSMDLVKKIRKTPIVVNDSRGFYTSRVFATYVQEGIAMLSEGVNPALIDNAGRMAGMPVGPLALADEVSIELMYKIAKQTRADLGDAYVEHPATLVATKMVESLERIGKKAGAGFYDYPEGGKKHLWSGLTEHFPLADEQPSVEEVQQRLLHIQGIEAARCYEENVVTEPADADVGSIMGWGFCPQHGGVLSYIQTIGVREFVQQCDALAKAHGERFAPPALLRDMAEKGEKFYS